MKIRPLHECKRIARKHWSVRFMALSVVFSVGEAALPSVQPYLPASINPLWAALAVGVCTAGGLLCKFVSQEGLDDA